MVSADNIERWRNWHLLENGPAVRGGLDEALATLLANVRRFSCDCLYFGCGEEWNKSRYSGWDLCDLRVLDPRVIHWDILLGFPHGDGSMKHLRSKLTLGMLSKQQANFVFSECSRMLEEGGVFELTYRNFQHVVDRHQRGDMPFYAVQRFLFGGGLYYGSRRKSSWTRAEVDELASRYGFHTRKVGSHGATLTHMLERTGEKVRAYRHVPGGGFDMEGHRV